MLKIMAITHIVAYRAGHLGASDDDLHILAFCRTKGPQKSIVTGASKAMLPYVEGESHLGARGLIKTCCHPAKYASYAMTLQSLGT